MFSQRKGDMRFTLLTLVFVLGTIQQQHQANAYSTMSKENLFADVLLSELLNRVDKDNEPASQSQIYFGLIDDLPNLQKNVGLVSRSAKTTHDGNNEPSDEFDYRAIFGAHPSIRDQEYLQHSTLWGHHYINGGMGEMPPNRFAAIKTDATLPAYCNPPNPCPYGYEDSHGCISDFENTAIFSREYQAAQECTCDNEHMFDCAGQDSSSSSNANTNEMTSTMEKFLMHQFQNDNAIENGNGLVKKFYGFASGGRGGRSGRVGMKNPFLQGEKLPIAAKKGEHIVA